MKGRDRRKRAKERKEKNKPEKLISCLVLQGLADESTCRAEQRFQKSMNPNGCTGCLRYEDNN